MGRQMAMVFDLNKCIGCQTCSVACKVLWTTDNGKRDMWWCSVNTQPGRGTPRDYEQMGGGYDAGGKLILGPLPSPQDFGGASEFNWSEVHTSGVVSATMAPWRSRKAASQPRRTASRIGVTIAS